jgi:hypothetical protein
LQLFIRNTVCLVAGDSPAMQCFDLPSQYDTEHWTAGRQPPYPFTLTLENDKIARPVVGRPMESAGRNVVKVVKMSMFFFT